MNMTAQAQPKPTATPSFTPVRANLLQRKCACGGAPGLDGECAECRRKRLTLQRRAADQTGASTIPPIVHDVLRSPGQPLDAATRAFMEPRFGHDFGRVRVHADERATESAQAVNALAYTVGSDVVFGSGQYSPGTTGGRLLLAHELTHVVQQRNTADAGARGLTLGVANSLWEREADQIADHVLRSNKLERPVATTPLANSPGQLQRAECALGHIESECANAAASCQSVAEVCKRKYPTPADIQKLWSRGEKQAQRLADAGPNASRNMLHYLDHTGTELVMPTEAFSAHAETSKALLRHREKFLDGARRRLEKGQLVPGTVSEEMAWTDTASAYSLLSRDDLGYAVGGYTLCSKVHVTARPVEGNRFEITFVDWKVQAFDCYNWDPGKAVGIPGAEDTDLCCLENAGRAKHYRIRTEPWDNTDAASLAAGTITATLPGTTGSSSAPGTVSSGTTGSSSVPTGPPTASPPGWGERIRKRLFGRF